MLSRPSSVSCYRVSGPENAGALTFTLAFETAQFKKHLVKLYRDTYISPPPSAVAGMVGAILGVRRNHLREFACKRGLLTGAALLEYEGVINETMIVVKMKGWGRYIRSPKRNVLLYRPKYKIAVASLDTEIIDELEGRIEHLDFEFELFGGNDYNFVSYVGEVREGKLVRTLQGQGYCRLSDLEGVEGSGTLHLDFVNEESVEKYVFGQGVTLRLREEALAVDDGERRILVHESWKFLK